MTNSTIQLKTVTPIMRMFDIEKAKEFYTEYLEFKVDWEHRFEDGLPLYMQLSYGDCTIHLTEHFGDCSPGAAIRIEVTGITDLHTQLFMKNHKFSRPSLELTPWDTKELSVKDPFGNRITFFESK
ncbi:VOC family protein [Bacillus timonensis]|nr:VOC family protein [Bacillus timonensis]